MASSVYLFCSSLLCQIFERHHRIFRLAVVIGIAFFLVIGQDAIHAAYHHYSFYLSESLLFASYWLCFLPTLLVAIMAGAFRHQKYPFELSSLVIALVLTLLLSLWHLLLFSGWVYGISALVFDHTYEFWGTLMNALAADLYKTILVYGSVVGIRFLQLSKKSGNRNSQVDEDRAIQPSILVISTGRKHISLPVDDILIIRSATPYIAIHTTHGKYLHNSTLKGILEKLDSRQFIRVHKSAIVNLNQVASYTSRLNGDYDIILSGGETIRLSRNYRDLFRNRFM